MHTRKRILVISNYPIKKPLHGGQKRVAAIVEEYRKHFSDVKFVAIFVREHYPVYANTDLYLTGEWANAAVHDHLTSDVKIGQAMTESPTLKRKIKKLLLSYKPDVIEIEQVFPFIGLQKILDELHMSPKIIHSSHNIETTMKKDIMTIGKADAKAIDKAVEIISSTEDYLAQHADLVAAVSKSDGDYYLKHGAKQYTLASNGISKTTATNQALSYWENFYKKYGIKHKIIFIGSAHLPNMQGIRDVLGLRLGFLPEGARVILAGGAGQHLQDHFDTSNLLDITFWQRAHNVGILSEELLSGLIASADIILLPIVDGGGSNLKTAEAILSGKKVVATNFAFRGYEKYMKLPNIYTADGPEEFRQKIIEAVNTPLQERSDEENTLAAQVEWKHCLSDMIKEVSKL